MCSDQFVEPSSFRCFILKNSSFTKVVIFHKNLKLSSPRAFHKISSAFSSEAKKKEENDFATKKILRVQNKNQSEKKSLNFYDDSYGFIVKC
jgi:hypothetical protein